MLPQILFTHPGTQYAPALATQLQRVGVLQRYATGILFSDSPRDQRRRWMERLGLGRLAARRLAYGVPPEKLHWQAGHEVLAIVRHQWLGHSNDAAFGYRNKKFQQRIPNAWIDEADGIIGFDTCSYILAQRCRNMGKPYFLDASIAHPLEKENIYAHLREAYPLWAEGLEAKKPELIELELQEMELASHIVVASHFTQSTYLTQGIAAAKMDINPYGVNLQRFTSRWEQATPPPTPAKGALRFFFMGAYNARKGFPWLCRLWQQLHRQYPQATLVAAGYDALPPGFVPPPGMQVIGAIHPADRLHHFHQADVFIFPSFFEGFAQTIIEAMACGLPVLATTHTCAPDVIEAGKEGWYTEPGNDDAMLQHMQWLLEHPEAIEPMGRAARQKALQYSWDAYGDRWLQILQHGVILS